MSSQEPRRIKLDGTLTEDQLRIVQDEVVDLLINRTGDLVHLDNHPDPKRELGEIAALSRLAAGLERGEVEVPDRIATDVAEGLAETNDELFEYEEIRRRYEAGIAQHDALHASFAGLLRTPPPASGEEG